MTKRALVKLGFYSGLFHAWLKTRKSRSFRVLMYHHVTTEPEPFLPHVTVDVFRRQIDYLRNNYRLMELGRIVDMIKRGEDLPPRAIALTFDDEYDDIYHNVFPLLKEKNIPAMVFISTGFVDTEKVPWTDELGFLFKETEEDGLEINGDRFYWHDSSSRLKSCRAVKNALKSMPEEKRAGIFEEVKRQLKVKRPNPARILGNRKIKEMAEAGISFGAHTVNHRILTRVSLPLAREEIEGSKKRLEEITGKAVRGFCYPNGEEGDFNPEIKALVREAGFDYACSTIEGVNTPETDLYELKRLWTSEPCLPVFAARLLRQSA